MLVLRKRRNFVVGKGYWFLEIYFERINSY
jgi:hypothetical protein